MVHSIPTSSSFGATPLNSNNIMNNNSNYYYPHNSSYSNSYYQYPTIHSAPDYDGGVEQPRKFRRYSMPVASHTVMHNPISIPSGSTPTSSSSSSSWIPMSPSSVNSVSPTNLSYNTTSGINKPLKRNYLSSPTAFSLNLNLQQSNINHNNSNVNLVHLGNNNIDDDLQFDDADSNDYSPPSSPTLNSANSGINKSAIECGNIDETTGTRVFTIDSDYFEKNVEIYVAANDPSRRVLYRASALAEKFGCATNKVGMYLSRRRNSEEGLYQASGFLYKPPGRSGLKSGGYFLSMEVCQGFEEHYCRQSHRQKARQQRRQQASANLRANAALLTSGNGKSVSSSRNSSSTKPSDDDASVSNHDSDLRPLSSKDAFVDFTELSDCSNSTLEDTPVQSPVSADSTLSYSVPLNHAHSRLHDQSSYSYPQSHSVPSSYTYNESYLTNQVNNRPSHSSMMMVSNHDSNHYHSLQHGMFLQYDSMHSTDGSVVKMEECGFYDDYGVPSNQSEIDYAYGILY